MDDASALSMTTTTTSSSESPRILRSVRLPWQRQMTPKEDGYLVQHLLKHESFRRIIAVRKPNTTTITTSVPGTVTTTTTVNEKENAATTSDPMNKVTMDSLSAPPSQLGSFDMTGAVADTLEGYVVAPLFQLRGMDIFLSEDIPEMESSTHPYLLEHGLRSVPTFIVNILTQWGNIFIYFEMPKWVQSFDMIVQESDPHMIVQESDPHDVKALKVCTHHGYSCLTHGCSLLFWLTTLYFPMLIVVMTAIYSSAILKRGCQLSQ